MTRITYHVVRHEDGWAYKLGDVFSESFPSHDAALKAAHRVAREQQRPGETTTISWEDADGHWHEEVARGNDRPVTEVDG
jgi:hypothetical protein